ncbi:hypothetical protein [Faecalispora jeddahensis]|uniref:hypothetical protein n=1 Tax=Faecalispora jeddahensis TaxID=1414721 RepID=UPI0004AD89EE|nr:hypothetical protein [Faecalispora jeddahensis]
MSKQIRVAIFHNEVDASKTYAEQLAAQIDAETVLINFRDPHPCAEVLPMRASPNVALLLFVDSLEELQEQIDVLRQLGYIRKQNTVTEIVDELVDVAGENLPDELATKIADTFYSE